MTEVKPIKGRFVIYSYDSFSQDDGYIGLVGTSPTIEKARESVKLRKLKKRNQLLGFHIFNEEGNLFF
jgi:hypothetical protein